MIATLHDSHKQNKLDQYLSTIKAGEQIKASTIAKTFCLTNAVSAGKRIWMRGDFQHCGKGMWRKEE